MPALASALFFFLMPGAIPVTGAVYFETTRPSFLTCFRTHFCYKTSEIHTSQSFVTSSAICPDQHAVGSPSRDQGRTLCSAQ